MVSDVDSKGALANVLSCCNSIDTPAPHYHWDAASLAEIDELFRSGATKDTELLGVATKSMDKHVEIYDRQDEVEYRLPVFVCVA